MLMCVPQGPMVLPCSTRVGGGDGGTAMLQKKKMRICISNIRAQKPACMHAMLHYS